MFGGVVLKLALRVEHGVRVKWVIAIISCECVCVCVCCRWVVVDLVSTPVNFALLVFFGARYTTTMTTRRIWVYQCHCFQGFWCRYWGGGYFWKFVREAWTTLYFRGPWPQCRTVGRVKAWCPQLCKKFQFKCRKCCVCYHEACGTASLAHASVIAAITPSLLWRSSLKYAKAVKQNCIFKPETKKPGVKEEKLCQLWPWDYLTCISFSSFIEVVLLWARNMAVLPPGLRWWGASKPQGNFDCQGVGYRWWWWWWWWVWRPLVSPVTADETLLVQPFSFFTPLLRCRTANHPGHFVKVGCQSPWEKPSPLSRIQRRHFSLLRFWLKLWKWNEPLCFDPLFPGPLTSQTVNGATDPPGKVLTHDFTRPALGLFGLVFTLKCLQLISTVDAWCFGVSTLHGYNKSGVSGSSPQKLWSSRDFCPTG